MAAINAPVPVPSNAPFQTLVTPRPADQERSQGVRTDTQTAVTEAEEDDGILADEDDERRNQISAQQDRESDGAAQAAGRGQILNISV